MTIIERLPIHVRSSFSCRPVNLSATPHILADCESCEAKKYFVDTRLRQVQKPGIQFFFVLGGKFST